MKIMSPENSRNNGNDDPACRNYHPGFTWHGKDAYIGGDPAEYIGLEQAQREINKMLKE